MKTYLLPENLNFQTHLKNYPPCNYRIPKFDLDSAKYLLTLISSVPLKNNDIEEELQDPEKGGFIPLSSVLMRDAVYNYNYYWSYFEKTGIVSIKRGYKSSIDGDGECMGYKFTGEYEFADFRKEKCKKPIVSKKDKLLEGIARKRYPDATRGLFKGLGFNSQGARDFNKKKLVAQKKDASLIELSKKGHNQEKDPDKQYKRSSQCIDLLENKDYYYNIDNFGRRLYWNLTSLPSFLRNFLSYQGPAGKERLVCIDIGNSQPYFSSLLLDKKFYEASGGKRSSETTITFKNLTRENMSALKEISESLLQIINSKNKDIGLYNSLVSSSSTLDIDILSFNSSINSGLSNRYIYSFFYNRSIYNFSLFKSKYFLPFSSSLMLQRCRKYEIYLSDNESCIKDGKIYQSILKNKSSLDLYEYMSNKSREDGSGYKTRKEMKTKMMIVYFSKNRHFKEEKESFKASFPTVHKLFRVIKKKEHQLLACVLQNIESHAVLNKLIPRLKNEFPQMPVYPIHDSITVPESYKDQVLAIMKEELLRLVGFLPRLKVEYWDPKNLEALEQMYDQVINKK